MFNLQPVHISYLYNSLSFHKTKDKTHMVLEPLQSIIQLGLLSVSPIGTKLTIQENILYLQSPSLIQPISRWYYADKKDDLFFLFQVIKRFVKWYNPVISKSSPLDNTFYELIIKMSIQGLHNLLKTYSSTDACTVGQVINMYISLLENNNHESLTLVKNVGEDVFESIIEIYDENIINTIFNILKLINLETEESTINNYISGLNLIMNKHNKQIQQWIYNKLIII